MTAARRIRAGCRVVHRLARDRDSRLIAIVLADTEPGSCGDAALDGAGARWSSSASSTSAALAALERAPRSSAIVSRSAPARSAASARPSDALAAGARFLVAPDFDAAVWAPPSERGVLHLPGVMTPTEVDQALAAGAPALKLFPAGALGPGHVADLLGPFPDARLVADRRRRRAQRGRVHRRGLPRGRLRRSPRPLRGPVTADGVAARARTLLSSDPHPDTQGNHMPIDGVLPVIPTPFRDGVFDRESFRRMLDHMLPSVDGYTLLGEHRRGAVADTTPSACGSSRPRWR